MTPIEKILSRLDKVREIGPGRFMCCCPAHPDRTPSMLATEKDNGRATVHCFAGCAYYEILSAIGLEPKDLYPDTSRNYTPLKPHERHVPRDVLMCNADDSLRVYVYADYTRRGEPLTDEAFEDLEDIARRSWAIAKEFYP